MTMHQPDKNTIVKTECLKTLDQPNGYTRHSIQANIDGINFSAEIDIHYVDDEVNHVTWYNDTPDIDEDQRQRILDCFEIDEGKV